MSYASVVILKKPGEFDDPLTYKVPGPLSAQISVGQGVNVPLRDNLVRGIVVNLDDKVEGDLDNLKEIDSFIPELSLGSMTIELAKQMGEYYRSSLTRTLKLMVPKVLWQGKGKRTLKKLEEEPYVRPDYSSFPLKDFEFVLTKEQDVALVAIKSAKKPVLLHGVTGSGKTEIYLRAILEACHKNKQAVLMVPEIALTPQMLEYFKKYFGEHLAVFHSKLSDGEKLKEWFKVKSGYAPLAIGSRSAIFAPLDELGLIIMDEEHEWTYKQESSPYYQTHKVAEMLMEIADAKFVMGTATPRIETLYKSRVGDYDYVRLASRVNDKSLPLVEVIDLRDEFKRKNFSIFSSSLQRGIVDRLAKKEQVILFVNQRGMARAIMCRDCGATDACPSCEVSMKLHGGNYGGQQYLLCHYCNYRTSPELTCKECGSSHIKQVGIGTERVEEDLRAMFPEARILRADKDTTSNKEGFEPIYKSFKNEDYDILIGTQMVAKGLDFPRVTLIGIILADVGLHVPDFRSHERLFHLITQVSGRAGRGEHAGKVVLQTYQPEHHAIKMAANYEYDEFVEQELSFRKKLKYPPYSSLIKFTVLGVDLEKLKKQIDLEVEVMEDMLKMNDLKATIIAAPAMIAKLGNFYYYHVLVRSENARLIFNHWKVPKSWRVDIDPIHTS